ncbi:hypothetical protein BKA62DRAFT_833632 [Auriculariales sp. MPI-PUGE-AT-0066]|nr:hypothetical protein BKA62DRAFT_833632 [Auriculariales sp. MPI-PUGE-AT-0066]
MCPQYTLIVCSPSPVSASPSPPPRRPLALAAVVVVLRWDVRRRTSVRRPRLHRLSVRHLIDISSDGQDAFAVGSGHACQVKDVTHPPMQAYQRHLMASALWPHRLDSICGRPGTSSLLATTPLMPRCRLFVPSADVLVADAQALCQGDALMRAMTKTQVALGHTVPQATHAPTNLQGP